MRHRARVNSSVRSVLVLIVLMAGTALAQQSGSGDKYGAVTVKFGTIGNSSAVFTGGRGGWVLNRNYGVGIGGYLLVGDVRARITDTSGNSRMMAGYGGLDFEYLVPLDSSFQVSVQALVGGGAVGFVENRYTNHRPHYDPFVVFEPGFNFGIALARFVQLTVGASYRFVGLLSSPVATTNELNAPMFSISLKAGFF